MRVVFILALIASPMLGVVNRAVESEIEGEWFSPVRLNLDTMGIEFSCKIQRIEFDIKNHTAIVYGGDYMIASYYYTTSSSVSFGFGCCREHIKRCEFNVRISQHSLILESSEHGTSYLVRAQFQQEPFRFRNIEQEH